MLNSCIFCIRWIIILGKYSYHLSLNNHPKRNVNVMSIGNCIILIIIYVFPIIYNNNYY